MRVMKAGNFDPNLQCYPCYISPKLDGVRAYIDSNLQVRSSAGKLIPNQHIQDKFGHIKSLEGMDGELIFGSPLWACCFRDTMKRVMSYNWHGKGIAFHVFDLQGKGDFEERYRDLVKIKRMLDNLRVCEDVLITPQIMVHSYEELMKYEGDWVEQGYEGVMVRSIHGIYKQGRSTAKDGYLLKLKRFKDDEAICTGVTKLISAYFDKLDQVGALRVYHPTLGNFDIGAGMTTEERIEFWKNPPRGQAIKFKYFGYGEYSKPRYPVFLGVRKDV